MFQRVIQPKADEYYTVLTTAPIISYIFQRNYTLIKEKSVYFPNTVLIIGVWKGGVIVAKNKKKKSEQNGSEQYSNNTQPQDAKNNKAEQGTKQQNCK